MKRKELIIQGLFVLGLFAGCAGRVAPAAQEEKAEAVTPIPRQSPPEGNMTFVDGVTWCVARPGAAQEDLQNALDWACGVGGADCSPLQPGGRCYQPDTLLSHASYAFNIFYQQNGNSDVACNFGGAGAIVKRDPSFGSCKFDVSCSLDDLVGRDVDGGRGRCVSARASTESLIIRHFVP
ncbi:hypothetical protein ACP4OV_012120 [Aristida adscensionis]